MKKAICLMIFAFVINGMTVFSQDESAVCLNTVETALSAVDDQCNGLERNSACYGAHQVESRFSDETRTSDSFTNLGDRGELVQFSEIQPQPLNSETGEFGVGVLNLQANVPNSLPGQGVIFVLAGNARLTNEAQGDLTPFQSFYFLPGIGEPACYESAPMLVIQTPQDATINIVLNGVDTEMTPGTLLTITPTVCTIHRGQITQTVGDETAVLGANETVDITIDDEGKVNVFNARRISEREYVRGQQIQSVLNGLAEANEWDEQVIAETSDFDEEPDREALLNPPVSDECEVEHVVYYDETLHSIAQKYDTSVISIVEANVLKNPRLIYPDDVLCIPAIGDGFAPLPAGW